MERTLTQNAAWKDIPGYPGYQVSELGEVKRIAHNKRWANHGKEGSYHVGEKILSQIKTTTGYPQVNLYGKSVHIHRLVARAFIENSKNKPQINHKDGNKSNNHVSNLEWVTQSENGLHAYRVLKIKNPMRGRFGKLSPSSKPVLQKLPNGKLVKFWDSAMGAVREFGFSSAAISRCCSGSGKIHKGYIWEYATNE